MKHTPPLLEEAAVGDLVGEGVLEGVLALGKEARLVEKLGRLEVRETTVQDVFGPLGNGRSCTRTVRVIRIVSKKGMISP